MIFRLADIWPIGVPNSTSCTSPAGMAGLARVSTGAQ